VVHPSDTYNAVVLAGGRSSRLGGINKTLLLFDGESLLERTIRAVRGANHIVVASQRDAPEPGISPTREDLAPVSWVRDDEPFGGPAAALASGLRTLAADPAPWVVVLSADLPFASAALPTLLDARPATSASVAAPAAGYIGEDPDGRLQFLLACYRTADLESALAAATRPGTGGTRGTLAGTSMKRVLAPLQLVPVPLTAEWCTDIDTPDDARRHGILLPTLPEHEGAYAR